MSTLAEYTPIRWLDVTETAKLVRAQLKKHFPGEKFSVRSSRYAGGSSIDVGWTDGPTWNQVRRVIDVFSGSDFDGMVDLKTSNTHWLLPDGTVAIAHSGGGGSTRPDYYGDAPSPNAELVRIGADYVHGQRRESDEWRRAVLAMFAEKLGITLPDADDHRSLHEVKVPLAIRRSDGELLHMVETEREYVTQVAREFMSWRQGGSLDQGPQPEGNGRW